MKKKDNKTVKINLKASVFLISTVIIVALIFHVYNIKSIERLIRIKTGKIEEIKTLQNEIDELIITKQKLLEYERISKIARKKLKLVPNLQVNEKIKINKKEIDYLKKIIDRKYE